MAPMHILYRSSSTKITAEWCIVFTERNHTLFYSEIYFQSSANLFQSWENKYEKFNLVKHYTSWKHGVVENMKETVDLQVYHIRLKRNSNKHIIKWQSFYIERMYEPYYTMLILYWAHQHIQIMEFQERSIHVRQYAMIMCLYTKLWQKTSKVLCIHT